LKDLKNNTVPCFENMSSTPHDGHQSKHVPLKYLLTHLYLGSMTLEVPWPPS